MDSIIINIEQIVGLVNKELIFIIQFINFDDLQLYFPVNVCAITDYYVPQNLGDGSASSNDKETQDPPDSGLF